LHWSAIKMIQYFDLNWKVHVAKMRLRKVRNTFKWKLLRSFTCLRNFKKNISPLNRVIRLSKNEMSECPTTWGLFSFYWNINRLNFVHVLQVKPKSTRNTNIYWISSAHSRGISLLLGIADSFGNWIFENFEEMKKKTFVI
jgi:hypothetical protein